MEFIKLKWVESQSGGSRLVVMCFALVAFLLVVAALSAVSLNTCFASSYSKTKFDLIKQGDSMETVLNSLGLPLQMTVNYGTAGGLPIQINSPKRLDIEHYRHNSEGNVVWQYSGCLHRFGDHFLDVSVTFTNGCVQVKCNEIYHEWW